MQSAYTTTTTTTTTTTMVQHGETMVHACTQKRTFDGAERERRRRRITSSMCMCFVRSHTQDSRHDTVRWMLLLVLMLCVVARPGSRCGHSFSRVDECAQPIYIALSLSFSFATRKKETNCYIAMRLAATRCSLAGSIHSHSF